MYTFEALVEHLKSLKGLADSLFIARRGEEPEAWFGRQNLDRPTSELSDPEVSIAQPEGPFMSGLWTDVKPPENFDQIAELLRMPDVNGVCLLVLRTPDFQGRAYLYLERQATPPLDLVMYHGVRVAGSTKPEDYAAGLVRQFSPGGAWDWLRTRIEGTYDATPLTEGARVLAQFGLLFGHRN